jgi:hypothetical protein
LLEGAAHIGILPEVNDLAADLLRFPQQILIRWSSERRSVDFAPLAGERGGEVESVGPADGLSPSGAGTFLARHQNL